MTIDRNNLIEFFLSNTDIIKQQSFDLSNFIERKINWWL